MSHVAGEIASQPDVWRRATVLAADALPLPPTGARVALTGCGTSLYMARAAAALREAGGLGETDAFPASEFPAGRHYDHVVALTRSGTTTEVVRLLDDLSGRRDRADRTTVVTTDATLPVATRADAVVALDFADEQSVVQTRFATGVLALWRAHLGADLTAAIAQAPAHLDTDVSGLASAQQFTFLGTGWTAALADEAALKVREASQSWAEAYPAMEFRHGPISVVGDRSVVWFFGDPPEGLVDEVERTGATVVTSTDDPMAHLVAAQRLAVAIAERKGLDPDSPRNLTRSIVLSPA